MEIKRVAPFVDRPVQVGPFAPHLYVGLIQTPARIKAAPPEPAETLLHLRRVALHPAIDRRMIDIDPTLGQHFLEITVADAVSTIPAHRSEEHTSELQSLMRTSYDVFCLKKKKQHKHTQENRAH